jgi:hypothetical protein
MELEIEIRDMKIEAEFGHIVVEAALCTTQ